MKLIKFYQSLTFKLTAALIVVTYLLSIMFMVGQLLLSDFNKQPNVELMAWYQKIQPVLSQTLSRDDDILPLQQQLANTVKLATSSFSYDGQQFDITINGVALISLESKLMAQIGSFEFDNGDIGAQIPIRSRDDLSDKLVGHYNSGLEHYNGNHLYIRTVNNEKGEAIAVAMFDLNWPINQFKSDKLTQLSQSIFPDLLSYAAVPLIFVLPCGFCIIFFASRQLKSRLNHLYKTIAHWSVGELDHKIKMTSNDELGVSFSRLNVMAEQLAQTIATNNQLQALQQRNLLAAELHDTVKQQLFANNLSLAACKQLFDSDTEQAKQLLNDVSVQNKAAFEQINHLISTLHQPTATTSLVAEIQTIISEWQQQNSAEICADININIELSQLLKTICTRALIEALQNVRKHSNATKVTIKLWHSAQSLHLYIEDNGNITSHIKFGQGLTLLKSSVEQCAGSFHIKTNEGAGITIKIDLPLAEDKP